MPAAADNSCFTPGDELHVTILRQSPSVIQISFKIEVHHTRE